MANDAPDVEETVTPGASDDSKSKAKAERRKIPGNMPYTSAPGAVRRALEKIPVIEKPSVFNQDFLQTVMQISGGSSRPVIPILKSTGFLSQASAPTELYSQFQTEAGRSSAALQALRNGFSEVFRRNQFAHRADDSALTDIIVAITGLPKGDQIVKYIFNTFQVFQAFARDAVDARGNANEPPAGKDSADTEAPLTAPATNKTIGLVYNLNIVLPETTNVEVYNAIFKSIKGNLLRD